MIGNKQKKIISINKVLKQYDRLLAQLIEIAEDRATSAETLEKLAELTDAQILTAVDVHPNTPSSILERRLRIYNGLDGSDVEVRKHIVYNSALSLKVLKKISATDGSKEVRAAATTSLAKRARRKRER